MTAKSIFLKRRLDDTSLSSKFITSYGIKYNTLTIGIWSKSYPEPFHSCSHCDHRCNRLYLCQSFWFYILYILSNLGNINPLPGVSLSIFHLCSQNSFQTVLTLRHLYIAITLLHNLLQLFVYMLFRLPCNPLYIISIYISRRIHPIILQKPQAKGL